MVRYYVVLDVGGRAEDYWVDAADRDDAIRKAQERDGYLWGIVICATEASKIGGERKASEPRITDCSKKTRKLIERAMQQAGQVDVIHELADRLLVLEEQKWELVRLVERKNAAIRQKNQEISAMQLERKAIKQILKGGVGR